MKRSMQELKRPYRSDDFRLVRAGRRGTYWQGADGKRVRLSADESESVVERSRVSAAVWLIALFASGAAKR